MEFRIDQQIIIENASYEALGDDFSFRDRETVILLINDISTVFSGIATEVVIYGVMCYRIHVTKNESSIYCYEQLLGK